MKLAELTFKRRVVVWFILICIVIGGILSYKMISKLEDPELVVMMSQIVTIYPGASAHEVEMEVTNHIERALNTLEDVESIRSRSMPGISMVSVMLELTVPQNEIEQRWDFLRRRMSEVIPELPEGAFPPIVYDDFGDVYGMFYAMTAEGFSPKEMSKTARYIEREMLAIKGVARVEIFGEREPVAEIVFDPSRARSLGVFPLQIMTALQGNNSMVYPGMMSTGDKKLNIVVSDRISSIEDIENTIVKGVDGSVFKISDIAEVHESYSEPARNVMLFNTRDAIGISLSMESGENIVEVGKRVEKRLAELYENLPAGYEFEKVFFQPDQVSSSITGFVENLIMSVVIVILVLMVSMGFRSGVIIGIGLLLTILATFPLLLAAGGTLQRISLGAFIVAMGMLVDNAIVVLDGILIDLKSGVSRKQALTDPAKRTAWPLFGATFIAVAAFLPVYLSKDAAGTYSRDLFVVLCLSLFISWTLAMTQIPLFAEKMLVDKNQRSTKKLFDNRFYRNFKRLLQLLLHYKTATLFVSALLLTVAALNFQNIKKNFFPDFDYNQVYIEYILPADAGPDKVIDDLRKISQYLCSMGEIRMVAASQGQTPTRYCLVRPMGEASDNYGELIMNFDDYEEMNRMKPVITDYLREHYPDARIRIRKYNLSIKASHTVEVEFTGPDPAILRRLGDQAEEIFRRNPYTDTYTVGNDWESATGILIAGYDNQAAARAGISRSDIGYTLLASTDGLPIGDYYEGQSRVGIVMKLRNSDGSRIENSDDIPVWPLMPNLSGIDANTLRDLMYGIKTTDELLAELTTPVPLSSVTNGLKFAWNEPVVRRLNGQRSLQVECEPLDGYSPAAVRRAMIKEIEAIPLPPGYSCMWVGEYELQKDALGNIFRFLPISVMLILITLILLFNDIRKPIIILSCIPMAFVGIVPGMIIAGQPFTFMAIIGSFGLMGMIVKNAIVLVDEAERRIESGEAKYGALINATISRTRPVLLASLTTIMGMLPLINDPMYASMAVAIISGLLVGTLITLLFVPILYAVFYRVACDNETINNMNG